MNFKLIKAGVAAFAMLTVPLAAQAADVPIKAPYYKGAPRSVVSYYNWTGFYAGINVGYGMGTSHWASFVGAETIKPKGFLAGGTFGYNWQSGAIVYGVEGDFDWSNVKNTVVCGSGIFTGAVRCETSSNWLATFRGRVGYAFDRWLPYVTAGGAYGNVKATASIPVLGFSESASKSMFGWTFGAGLEYAFLGNWTAKIEYLYVDLGHFDATPISTSVSFKENIVRAGLNYKFSGPIFSRF
jgi:outer membrane immunogenic protein